MFQPPVSISSHPIPRMRVDSQAINSEIRRPDCCASPPYLSGRPCC